MTSEAFTPESGQMMYTLGRRWWELAVTLQSSGYLRVASSGINTIRNVRSRETMAHDLWLFWWQRGLDAERTN